MPLPLLAMGGLSLASLLGGLFKKKATSTTTGTQTGTTTGTSSSSTTPTISPEFAGLNSIIMPMISQRLTSGGLPSGYEEGGISKINDTYATASQGLSNDLTSRGLGSSPVAGHALAVMNRGRAGDIAGFRRDLPLAQRQLQNEDMATALGYLNFGRGTSTTGTNSNTVTGSQSGTTTGATGGGIGGGLDSLASMLGFLIGNGSFGGRPTSGTMPINPSAMGY